MYGKKTNTGNMTDTLSKHSRHYCDGSYAEEPTIQTIFKTDTLKRTASASVIIKDSSHDWARHPIIILRITDGAEVGSKSVYPMEFLTLAAAIWIRKEGGHRAPVHTDAQSVLDTVTQRRKHFKSAKTSCHIPLRRIADNNISDYMLHKR